MFNIVLLMFIMFIDDDVDESICVLLDVVVYKRIMVERRIGCFLLGLCYVFFYF